MMNISTERDSPNRYRDGWPILCRPTELWRSFLWELSRSDEGFWCSSSTNDDATVTMASCRWVQFRKRRVATEWSRARSRERRRYSKQRMTCGKRPGRTAIPRSSRSWNHPTVSLLFVLTLRIDCHCNVFKDCAVCKLWLNSSRPSRTRDMVGLHVPKCGDPTPQTVSGLQ